MLSSTETRKQFLDFFTQRCGHTFVPSSPVVPHDDPTLLFANAGMNQFKDVFLGVGSRPYKRAVNTQKCIRAGGKHNDLDDVGKDTYHHTFFEMLGNWSFGDYFKRDAIHWAWQLLTDVWGLEKKRLHVTIFAGDAPQGLERDNEASELWKTVTDIDPTHIHLGDMKDNFWEMGDTGPCGPCSEIHIDLTEDYSGGKLVNAGTPQVIEIWNLVFIQFNRDVTKALTPLPAKHVDTGMGFERVCAVLQNKKSNYDTDVFSPIFAAIQDVTKASPYSGSLTRPEDIAYRVIADHIRTLTFALTDGALPGNTGRGSVLRRILRRAVRYGRQTLGVGETFFHRLVPVVVESMGGAFPELCKDPAAVADIIRDEEELFGRTLGRGIEHFNEAAARGGKEISGEDAFTLYSTYGFPLDLTQLMAAERGMKVDEKAFEAAMEEHQRTSRGEAGETDPRETLVELVQRGNFAKTKFVGYQSLSAPKVRGIAAFVVADGRYQPAASLKAGQSAALVADQTPFYAEAGGQVGDTGVITIGSAKFVVRDTVRIGDVYFHLGALEAGSVAKELLEGAWTLAVDEKRRRSIMAHHTTTHVMNHKLREVLGDHVQQKGSLVEAQRLRFDFNHSQAVTPAEMEKVESLVNADIGKDLPVYAAEVPQEEALKVHGLRAVFGEKYPPKVRVVSVGVPVESLLSDPSNKGWYDVSIEFCGGTHLNKTGEAGRFVIVAEEAVAKGVRRLTALAGTEAQTAVKEGEELLSRLAKVSKLMPEEVEKGIASLAEDLATKTVPAKVRSQARSTITELQKQAKEFQKQQNKAAASQIVDQARGIAERHQGEVLVASLTDADGDGLRTAMDVIHSLHPQAAMLLGSVASGKVSFVSRVPDALIKRGLKAGDWVKSAATVAGGGGGGRPDMAQAGGKDPSKLEEALDAGRAFAGQKLTS
ncbi:MAG: alanine--tRNA ligase [Planctomycetota bacterium]